MEKKFSALLYDVCHSQLKMPLKRLVSLHLALIGYFSIRYRKISKTKLRHVISFICSNSLATHMMLIGMTNSD
jgi:hypothetical protein